ncbi:MULTISPECIES: hypothetical protein [unclassified Butyrivibrio]|jgi:hypothetical protein|uniref:hypothetical protein n=1 Tax=unclassified Butyrivibrio TaxID=2639466 RepID=UPI000423F53D|nr:MULTISPECIES: hypothetical protein [unclassified Butyrivibrio]MCR5343212.1 hypothetical protein [Butyrivibrio sp.]
MSTLLAQEYNNEVENDNVIDYTLIRHMLRSIGNNHWSVSKAMDEYDVPTDQRDIYMETIADKFFVS